MAGKPKVKPAGKPGKVSTSGFNRVKKGSQGVIPGIGDLPAGPVVASAGIGVTVNKIAEQTHTDRRTVKKILQMSGLKPISAVDLGNRDSATYDPVLALDAIYKNRKQNSSSNRKDGEESPWIQSEREKVIKLQRENRIAEKLENETYIETQMVEQALVQFKSKLEMIPVKVESQFSLPAKVIARIQELMDEALSDMAQAVVRIKPEVQVAE